MVWTRATAPMDSNLNLDWSTGPGENTNNACSDMSRSTTRSPLLTTEARPDIQPIVEAIILAFTDQRLMEERLAPALGPALAPALHSCFMMELEKRDDQIKELEKNLTIAESRIEELEQYSRRNCLVIHGVKETTGEHTDQLICDLAKDKLTVDIKPEDIDRSHRIGERGRSDRRGRPLHRPIIVKFCGYGPRSSVYASRSKLKTTGIYIHENLTSERQSLLRKVKSRYNQEQHKVWTQDGKIKVKTPNRLFTIASNSDWKEHCERFMN